MPPGDTWCRLLPDGQVQALLGDVDPERVRQVGDVTPIGGVTQRCNIVWADGDTPVEIVALRTWSSPGGQAFVDEVTRMRDLFGPDGGRLASDEVREVLPGVYYVEADGQLAAHLACDVGAELPELLTGRLSMTPTESGRLPTTEELATVGEELAELAPWSHQCAGAVTPLGAQDWEALGDRYFELQDEG
ncbi:hypothetical protein V2J52_12615 [Georgenia sp. MJ173]|uniref:hypothetical protein n=1 Tax=Georgenia sunbinii TaxID=3117728 RepID=UPI002F26D248